MAQNRQGVHVLADRSGLSYGRVKMLLVHIMLDSPHAVEAALTLADAITKEAE